MKRDRDRAERLIDVGSTTALSAMVEIVSNGQPAGILARQASAMLARLGLELPEGPACAFAGFLDELQSFIESVPGARSQSLAPERSARRRRAA